MFDPFPHPKQTKMTIRRRKSAFGIKSSTVVGYSQLQVGILEVQLDENVFGIAFDRLSEPPCD
jgi:hypothetical protein